MLEEKERRLLYTGIKQRMVRKIKCSVDSAEKVISMSSTKFLMREKNRTKETNSIYTLLHFFVATEQ